MSCLQPHSPWLALHCLWAWLRMARDTVGCGELQTIPFGLASTPPGSQLGTERISPILPCPEANGSPAGNIGANSFFNQEEAVPRRYYSSTDDLLPSTEPQRRAIQARLSLSRGSRGWGGGGLIHWQAQSGEVGSLSDKDLGTWVRIPTQP